MERLPVGEEAKLRVAAIAFWRRANAEGILIQQEKYIINEAGFKWRISTDPSQAPRGSQAMVVRGPKDELVGILVYNPGQREYLWKPMPD